MRQTTAACEWLIGEVPRDNCIWKGVLLLLNRWGAPALLVQRPIANLQMCHCPKSLPFHCIAIHFILTFSQFLCIYIWSSSISTFLHWARPPCTAVHCFIFSRSCFYQLYFFFFCTLQFTALDALVCTGLDWRSVFLLDPPALILISTFHSTKILYPALVWTVDSEVHCTGLHCCAF